MAVLERLLREHVDFNPALPEHRKAYLMLNYQGQQHSKLRFVLRVPHTSVLHMMQDDMAKFLCAKEIHELGICTEYKEVSALTPECSTVRKRDVQQQQPHLWLLPAEYA